MSKANKRPGFGVMKGSTNSPAIVSYVRPIRPKINTFWVDKNTNKMYWWDGTTWNQVTET